MISATVPPRAVHRVVHGHMWRVIRNNAPDVLHIHMPNLSAFWALLLLSARRIPWVIHWHADVEASRYRISLRLGYPHYFIFERALLERADSIIVTSPQYVACATSRSRSESPASRHCG